MLETTQDLPVAMTIAGSDSGGGAGIQADLLTFAALGVFGTTAITCLTAQNPEGVTAVEAMPPSFVTEQLAQLRRYFKLAAVKTGMLFNEAIVCAVADFLRANPGLPAVVDPVMVATSGAVLLRDDAVQAIKERLLPLATVVTPNLDEVAVLLGRQPRALPAMREAGRELAERYGAAFLIKGGHLEGGTVYDLLVLPGGGEELHEHSRVEGVNTHGTGCTLASAIAAHLAKGLPLGESVRLGRDYLLRTLRNPLQVSGERFMAHL